METYMEEEAQDKKEEMHAPPESAPTEADVLRDQLVQSEKEKNEFLDLSRRMKADLINSKKDQEKATAGYVHFAIAEALLKFFPVMDSFDLAMKHVPKEFEGNAWAKGIISIKQQLDGALRDIGVTLIPTVGTQVSHDMHEAIAHEESDKDDGIILEEYQRGYMLYGKVIRPATVKISQKKQ